MTAETLDCGCVDDREDLTRRNYLRVRQCVCGEFYFGTPMRPVSDEVDTAKRVQDQLAGWTEAEKAEAWGK